ncbi:MAG: hypothetical protein JSS76_03565 [Bacteroidetes bacterium]|nr:hypothetical protein [Bacteroidota bacterium]
MAKSRIHKAPQRILGLSQDELEKIKEQFPYFQPARLLALRRDQQAGLQSDQSLSSASVYSHDRRSLHEYLKKKKQEATAKETYQPIEAEPKAEDLVTSKEVEPVEEKTAEVPVAGVEANAVSSEGFTSSEIPSDALIPIESEIALAQEQPVVADEVEAIEAEDTSAESTASSAVTSEEEIEEEEPAMEIAPADERRFIIADHTFDEWLDHFKKGKHSVKKTIEEIPQARQEAADELDRLIESSLPATYFHDKLESETQYAKGLESFIASEKKKKAPAVKATDYSMVTETLAKVYERQGLVDKAIAAYEQLSLKNPEKSAYFAVHIERLKNK